MANFDSFVYTGHGKTTSTGAFDPGATSGSDTEHAIASQITAKVREYLGATNLKIHYGLQNYANGLLKGNTYSKKFGVSVHLNAGGGRGPEVFVPLGEKHLTEDFTLCDSLAKILGTKSRGVKSKYYDTEGTTVRINGKSLVGTDWMKEIRDAWKLGISLAIVEVGFIDSKEDLAKIKANIDDIAFAIATYICNNSGVKLTKPAAPVARVRRVIVDGTQVGAYASTTSVNTAVNKAISNNAKEIKIQLK